MGRSASSVQHHFFLPSQELNISQPHEEKEGFLSPTATSSGKKIKEAGQAQIDTTVTFTELIVSIEQNDEFQYSVIESPMHTC